MSVLNLSGDEAPECPLCMEFLELDDYNFYPCSCGYQVTQARREIGRYEDNVSPVLDLSVLLEQNPDRRQWAMPSVQNTLHGESGRLQAAHVGRDGQNQGENRGIK